MSGLGRQIARQQQQQKQVTGSSRSLPSSWADSMEQETAAKSSTAVASDGNMESEPAEDHDDDIIEVSYQIFYFLTQQNTVVHATKVYLTSRCHYDPVEDRDNDAIIEVTEQIFLKKRSSCACIIMQKHLYYH